jgi:DNA-binding NtrC family response regulator
MATILVVDDEPMMLRLCQNMLERGQHAVVSASAGDQALALLNQHPIELALLDVMMPGINGIELAARIQQTYPDVQVLLMTGYGPREIAKVAGKENPYRIIWKPFKTEFLLQAIENMLGKA